MQLALRVLHTHWKISGQLRQETSGGSRTTWQLQSGDWLTRSDIRHSDAFHRETSLLELLYEGFRRSITPIQVPSVLKTSSGASLVAEDGFLWRVTKNIAGVRVRASDHRTYPELIKALDSLHCIFRDLPIEVAPEKKGVLETLDKLEISSLGSPLVTRLYECLVPKISSIQKHVGLTHGDFNPTNLIYEEDGASLRLVGILDFELCRPDPAAIDYSQLFSMIICHSGFTDPRSETEKIMSALHGRFSHEELRLAMLAYWIDLYSRWHKVSEATHAKMTMRLKQVWSFVQLYL